MSFGYGKSQYGVSKYGFGGLDSDPPYLDSLNPDENDIYISIDSNVFLKIKDDLSDINQSTVKIYINRGIGFENVWLSDTQQSGFSVTKNVINTQEISYDINPDVNFDFNELIQVKVIAYDFLNNKLEKIYSFNTVSDTTYISDYALNPIDPNYVSFYGFISSSEIQGNPHIIYTFLIDSIRNSDQKYGNQLIERWLDGLQIEFDNIYNKIKSLPNLFSPENCPEEGLQYLKWIVGLTSKLDYITGSLSTTELRRLISIAVKMWKYKGTEQGLLNVLEVLSARPVRILNWFYYRIIIDEVELGMDELNVDPWLLDQPGMLTNITPDSISVSKTLDMKVLPSSSNWTYINEGEIEANVFSIINEQLVHEQNNNNVFGGRYEIEDININSENVEIGAIWTPTTLTTIGGFPWHIYLIDGTNEFMLKWSNNQIALTDLSGNLIYGPISKGFTLNTSYKIRLAKSTSNKIVASIDGFDLFGEIDSTLFPSNSDKKYGFGYIDNNENQEWIVYWDDVGPKPIIEFDLSTLLGITEVVPHQIRVKYIEKNITEVVYSDWDGTKNRCIVDNAFGLNLPISTDINNYTVGVDPDEFVSDIRIMNEGGLLNTEFIENIVSVNRPSGERYNIRFLDFIDTFKRSFDWTIVSGDITQDISNGQIYLEHASQETSIKTDISGDSNWQNVQLISQFSLRDVDSSGNKWGEVRFNYTDELNFYALRIEPYTRLLSLNKVTSGVRTTLDSTTLDIWYPDLMYHFSIQTEDQGSSLLIKYFLDGNYINEVSDSDHTSGKMAIATGVGQQLILKYCELYQEPMQSIRVGP